MRRVSATVTAGLALMASLAVTAPAQAVEVPDWPLECIYELPPGPGIQSVYVDEEGRLILDPEAAPDDVRALAQHAPDLAFALYGCLVEPLPTEAVTCLTDLLLAIVGDINPAGLDFHYVYPNPSGSGYAVDIEQLGQDVQRAVICTGIT
jgi:hypothetical protein